MGSKPDLWAVLNGIKIRSNRSCELYRWYRQSATGEIVQIVQNIHRGSQVTNDTVFTIKTLFKNTFMA